MSILTDAAVKAFDLDQRITEGRVAANGVDFAYLECGAGPLALCLHGFPDTAFTWRYLLPQLADAGFRAVAPFTRGYDPTTVPGDSDYTLDALAADAGALHTALEGTSEAVLIGHDWGALAVYRTGKAQADKWRRLVALAMPPPQCVSSGFFAYEQIRRSSYIFVFQHVLAEMIVMNNDHEFIRRLWAEWSPGYADAAPDVERVREALGKPENLSAALGYYRAMMHPDNLGSLMADADAMCPQPLLHLHGADDGCMGADIAAGARDYLSDGSDSIVIEGCGHFLQLENPAVVNREILNFLI